MDLRCVDSSADRCLFAVSQPDRVLSVTSHPISRRTLAHSGTYPFCFPGKPSFDRTAASSRSASARSSSASCKSTTASSSGKTSSAPSVATYRLGERLKSFFTTSAVLTTAESPVSACHSWKTWPICLMCSSWR